MVLKLKLKLSQCQFWINKINFELYNIFDNIIQFSFKPWTSGCKYDVHIDILETFNLF